MRGLKDAESRKALRTVLRKDGIFLTDARSAEGAAAIAAAGKIDAFSGQGLSREVDLRALFGSRVSAQDLAISTRQLATLIGAHADSVAIDQAAIRAGMTTMVDDGIAKIRAGMTSPAEVLRVTTLR